MADSVSNKQSQRRLAKESVYNNSDITTKTNSSKSNSSSNNKSAAKTSNSINTDDKEAVANTLVLKQSLKTQKATASADLYTSATEEEEEVVVVDRRQQQRSAKSKAREAITSILVHHNTSSSETAAAVATTSKTTKIDQNNSTTKQQTRHSTNNFASNFDIEEKSNQRSPSNKRRRSQSSTAASTSTQSSRKTNNKTTATAAAASPSDKSSHNLRSQAKSSSSKKRSSRKSDKSIKTVPNKKAKLNSDINNNLNVTRSTSRSSSSSSTSSRSSSSSSSSSSLSSSDNSQLFATASNRKKSKRTTDNISVSTKELGNTCNIRTKETTGGCITRPTLRRSSQQQQQQQQIDLQESAASSQQTVAASQKRTSNKNSKSSSSRTATASATSKKGSSTFATSASVVLNNMNQQNSNINTNNNNNNNVTSSSTTAATATTTTSTTTSPLGEFFSTNAVASNATAAAPTLNAYSFPISESESDDNADFSRLTDMLQARGLPSHIVNAFGNKVQQFLSRTMSSGMGRSQQLMQSLQQNDESLKLTALTELCQLLVMGNEDTLAGFPIKQAVPLLLQCMNSENNNYDLMNHACRALTYMMESLPRSSSAIAEGIPIFLEKLQIIQCMDVAEQALTALEILSRRNSKQILHSNGISACLTYIDFFSITAQRNALQITANCCQNMIKDEFVHIQSSLAILAQRLTHSDKKSVESVCIIFSRLVENFQRDQTILKEIASHDVLKNLQQILVLQPQLISSAIFVLVLHTMHIMCINCTELAVELLQNGITETLKYLLAGPSSNSTSPTTKKQAKASLQKQASTEQQQHIELVSRSPQELYEIVSLISEILPKLPNTGIFQIDDALKKSSTSHQNNHIIWQWKDEREIWRPYTPIDSRIIEAAFSQEEDEVSLSTMGRTYVIDFNAMLQINEETGTARPVLRKLIGGGQSGYLAPPPVQPPVPVAAALKQEATELIDNNLIEMATSSSSSSDIVVPKVEPIEMTTAAAVSITTTKRSNQTDHRFEFLNTNNTVYADFVRSLFAILYEVYSSSAGPAIKHRCLRALLRMIYYMDSELLHDVLSNLTISSHIASMLASQDLKITVCALQMCEILMQKLQSVFSIYFHREGVIHQIDRLIELHANSKTPLAHLVSSVSSSVLPVVEQQQQQQQQPSNSIIQPSQTFPNFFNTTASAMWPYGAAASTSSGITVATATTSAGSTAYKLTPFGMDAIIGDMTDMNYGDKAQSVIQQQQPMDQATTFQQPSNTAASSSTLSKSELKFVETLKRKVKTPKRPGRKSNKNDDVSASTSTGTTASNYDTTVEQPTTSNASASKYLQNVMSKISTNQRSSKTATTTAAAAATPATQSMYMPLYPQSFNASQPTPIPNYQSTAASVASSLPANNNRSSEFSLFGTQLWNHLRGAGSLIGRNSTSASPTTATTTASSQSNKLSYTQPNISNYTVPQNIKTSATTTTTASSGIPTYRGKKAYSVTNPTSTGLSSSLPTASSTHQLIDYHAINLNKEKVRQWIYEQAKKFKEKYFSSSIEQTTESLTTSGSTTHPGLNILQRLNSAVNKLSVNSDNNSLAALKEVSNIIYETDISSFEMIHSGLITKLLEFLTIDGVFSKVVRVKQFLHVFSNLPLLNIELDETSSSNTKNLLNNLISKLHNCVNQLEQYAVRVHDVPNSIGYGKTAIKFFNTHQLKCLLQRHPDSTTIRQWKGGPVKVDPLAVVSAIEKYLIMRGMNKAPQANDSEDSDNSDDDIEEAMSAILGRTQDTNGPRLELIINDHVLPSNITIYQAIKQYTLHADTDNETDTESFVNNEIWSKVHTITYKLASSSTTANTSTATASASTSSKTTTATTTEKRTTRTSLLSALGNSSSSSKTAAATATATTSKRATSSNVSSSSQETRLLSNAHFFENLNNDWLKELTISDSSLEAISLLRLLYALNRNWYLLYNDYSKYSELVLNHSQTAQSFMLNSSEFVNSKLTAKANRQLQDPLVIMTGHLPKWLPELIKTCGFLFPFETRLMFFYASSFDRDRAMQKLLDLNTEIGNANDGTNNNERIVPKIDRKKKTIVRDSDILKQSETILNDFGKSKALLEIQYENEVGTGLGPTLEFYALVSLEIQKTDYELWRGDKIKISTASGTNQNCLFYSSPNGLFPAPLAKNAKQQHVNKIRNKFKFFGKFVAKAIMDFRILDIQLSTVFHKWLIDPSSLNEYDIKYVDNVLYRSMESLREYLHKHKTLVHKQTLYKQQQLLSLTESVESELKLIESEISNLDKSVRDLDLDFTLPGYSHIELKKNGKDVVVTLHNLDEYLKQITHWTLVEGVQKQFESFKEGFNSIFQISTLNQFYPEELDRLFCGSGYDIWDSKLLIECTRCDHGYTHDSKAVQFLFEILSSYSPDEQRLFLQFVTGSPRLPVGGLRSLAPQLTIVRKAIEGSDSNPDNYLPSVMTCVNYLKLPEYTNVDIMREKLHKAMTEGQLSFNLS